MKEHSIEARRWFAQAQADIAVVRTLLSAKHYAAACFHAQQAAEKALKAVLFSQGERFALGHSVRELARRCEEFDRVFATLAPDASLLDQFYIPTRYPNGLPSPAVPDDVYTGVQALMAKEASERVLSTTEAFLASADRRPNVKPAGDVSL